MSTDPMPGSTTESDWEAFALERLAELAWPTAPGTDIAPGAENGRTRWDDLALPDRLLAALRRSTPTCPVLPAAGGRRDPRAAVPRRDHREPPHARATSPAATAASPTSTPTAEATPTIRLLSADPDQNDWLAVNQVTIRRGEDHRRFDLVLYCNGMPVSIVELKRGGNQRVGAPPPTRSCRPTSASSRWRSGSPCSPGLRRSHRPVRNTFHPANHYSPWNVDDDGVPPGPVTRRRR